MVSLASDAISLGANHDIVALREAALPCDLNPAIVRVGKHVSQVALRRIALYD